jgi:hypothetical protein
MNKGICVIFATVGAGIGSAVTYFIMNKKLKDKDQEVVDIRANYREKLKEMQESRKAVEDMSQKKDEIMNELEKKVNDKKLEPKQPENYTDYSSISKKKTVKTSTPNPIKFITDNEAQKILDESNEYELVGLSLYEDNVIIDDETDNILEDYGFWIGDDAIDNIRKSYTGEERSIYILNETSKAIYDITVIEERFGDYREPVEIE